MANRTDEKREVAIGCRVLAEMGLASGITASLGHVSQRLSEDASLFAVKGRGYELDALATMNADDVVICDLDGFKVEGPKGVTQCTEVQLHACIYKNRADVQSIVHVHPRFTVLASVLHKDLVRFVERALTSFGDLFPGFPISPSSQASKMVRLSLPVLVPKGQCC